jgi:hypothetical protein
MSNISIIMNMINTMNTMNMINTMNTINISNMCNIINVMNVINIIEKIDKILLMLGVEITLPIESLYFYHSASTKFESLNKLGHWFSPLQLKEKPLNYISNIKNPLWSNEYDFRFINKKPLKLLLINTFCNDFKYMKLIQIIKNVIETIKCELKIYYENMINNKNEVDEMDEMDLQFMTNNEDDPEYILAYYLCKYSSFDGWITDASYLGFCMLKLDTINKLKLVSVSTPPTTPTTHNNHTIIYYTSKQWKEQFI